MKPSKIFFYFLGLFFCLRLISSTTVSAKIAKGEKQKLSKINTIDYKLMDVNNIAAWFSNNGINCSDPVTGQSGLYYPNGAPTDHTVIYTSGLWVLGKIGGEIRSAAADYATEFQPGMILGVGGLPDDPNDSKYRVFKFTRDNWDSPEMAQDRAEAIAQGMENKMYGDQMLYCVYNDYANHSGVWTKDPIGLEVHQLVFGYRLPSALKNVIFIKYTFINKGTQPLEDAYVAQFFDPDDGGASDDGVGCDTTLGIGYAYNMDDNDDVYGAAVPCFGCDFLQGPVVPSVGDTAYLPGEEPIPDHKVLSMTAFAVYIGGGPRGMSDPTLQSSKGAQMAYWYCSGLKGDSTHWRDPTRGNSITKFPFSGDPVAGTGWIQALTWDGDDMRMSLASGPFTLEIGVPYTVAVGYIVGQAESNLSSITMMKYCDRSAQLVYDSNFLSMPPLPQPTVEVVQLNQEVVLSWDTNASSYCSKRIRGLEDMGRYEFEGYNVYQGETENGPWHRIAVFDKKNGVRTVMDYGYSEKLGYMAEIKVAEGKDSGVQHYIDIKKDWQGKRLVNGKYYYFAVTAYAYNLKGVPKVIETEKKTVVAIPQFPLLNTKYNADVGDTVQVFHQGSSDAKCEVRVLAPSKLTGHEYRVEFYPFGSDTSKDWRWKLTDVTVGKDVLVDQKNFSGDEAYPVVDGFLIKVSGPTIVDYGLNLNKGIYSSYARGYGGFSFWGGCYITGVNWGGVTFYGGMDIGEKFYGSTLGPLDYINVRIDFWNKWHNTLDPDQYPWSKAYVYRRDKGFKFEGMGDFPGAAYDVDNPDHPRRLNLCFLEDGRDSLGIADLRWDPVACSEAGLPKGGYEVLFIMNSGYDPTGSTYPADAEPFVNDGLWAPGADVLYVIWPTQRGNYYTGNEEFKFWIWCNHPVTTDDKFTFSTAAPTVSDDIARSRINEINVFPNPYFGYNKAEKNYYRHFVTFSHLPPECTIRIFSLSGQLVKTIAHNNGTGFERWDLTNDSSPELPVASGMYIAYVKIPNVGVKVLKLAVIMPRESFILY